MEIVEYNRSKDVLVKFLEHGNLVHTSWESFNRGGVKNVFDRSVYGIGYIGEGKYKTKENGKHTPQYDSWHTMLGRIYGAHSAKLNPSYINVTVCDEWFNFQTFAEWYDQNYYQVNGERMNLDKDILIKGNREYSPNACIFVPARINSLFVKNNTNRGDLPIGVTYDKRTKKYVARCSGGLKKKTEHLSDHNTPEEAFYAYKINKELVIRDIANEYKDKIPEKLYNAMINYKVEITD
jgi:hypothetical protein